MSHTLAIQAWGVSMPGDALACIAGEFLPMCTCLMVGAMGSVVSKAVSPPVFRNPDAAPQRADGIGRTVEWARMRSIDTGLVGCREVYSAEHRESLQSTKTRTSSYLVRWRSIGVVM